MGIETGNEVSDLNANWPLGSDPRSEGDDHLRLIKGVMANDVLAKSVGGTVRGNLTVQPVTGNSNLISRSSGGSALAQHIMQDGAGTNRGVLQFDPSGPKVELRYLDSGGIAASFLRLSDGLAEVSPDLHVLGDFSQFRGAVEFRRFMDTSNRLNYVLDGTTAARMDPAGTGATGSLTILTREKGDGRYQAASSDQALKERIEDMPEVGAVIAALRPVTFYWRADPDDPHPELQQCGLIAQEVEGVLPGAVRGEDGHKGIDALNLVGVLVKAVQELTARVEALES